MKPNTLKSFALVVVMIVLSACNSTMVAPRALTVNAPGNGSAAKPITLVDSSGKLHYAWQECWPELYDPTKAEKDTHYITVCRVVYRSYIGNQMIAELSAINSEKAVTNPQMVVRANGEVWVIIKSCFVRSSFKGNCNIQAVVIPPGYTSGDVVVRNLLANEVDSDTFDLLYKPKLTLLSDDRVIVTYRDYGTGNFRENRYRQLAPTFSEINYYVDQTTDNPSSAQRLLGIDSSVANTTIALTTDENAWMSFQDFFAFKFYEQKSSTSNFDFIKAITVTLPINSFYTWSKIDQSQEISSVVYANITVYYSIMGCVYCNSGMDEYAVKSNLSQKTLEANTIQPPDSTLAPWSIQYRAISAINGTPVYLLLARNKNSLSASFDVFYQDEQNKLTQLTQLTQDNQFIGATQIKRVVDNGVEKSVLAWRECRHTDAGGQVYICDVSAWSPGMQVQKIYTGTHSAVGDLGTDLYFNGNKLSAIWIDPDAQNTRAVPYVTYNKIDNSKKIFLPITLMPQ